MNLLTTLIIFFTIFFKQEKITLDISKNLNSEKYFNFNLEENSIQKDNWSLSIPKINLENVQICENTSAEVLENYIGHFNQSNMFMGNVCLAAHNDGFPNNYFKNLYLLENGDKIIYKFNGLEKEYIVQEKYIIDEEDFSVLEYSNEDEITLVTCVSGSPSKRLCVRGVVYE